MKNEVQNNTNHPIGKLLCGLLWSEGKPARNILQRKHEVAACENFSEVNTNLPKVQYYENHTEDSTSNSEELEGQFMPAVKPARDPLADKEVTKTSDEDQGNSMNTISAADAGNKSAEVDLVDKALAIVGSPKQLAAWMRASLPALQGKTPYSLMNSEEGRKQVEAVLGSIEHGIY